MSTEYGLPGIMSPCCRGETVSMDEEKKMKKKRKSQERWVRNTGKKIKDERPDINCPEVGSFAWLDKELSKIEREKQRLEREKMKTMERESRLIAMRQALGQQAPAKKEITVKTAAGEEFKFEGINPKFTQKLYEWESRRGIAPECSTITLLNNLKVEEAGDLSSDTRQSHCDSSSSLVCSVPEERERIIGSTINRTDSVKTHSSLKLIHEKMSLLANLQEKADQCRYLESQLDSLDDKMSCVAKSR